MSVLSHQSAINPTKNFWVPEGSGGAGANVLNTSTINANTMKVSTITNAFSYLGVSTTTFSPVFFRQDAPVGSQMPRFQMKLTQTAQDAGAIQTVELGVDFKNATSYLNSVWDGYILMPMEMNLQDLTIQDETGLCMYVNNQVTQVPALSTINVNTASINNMPYVAPTYLSTSSNYSSAFTFNGGSNVSLLSYNFGSIVPAGTYEYSAPISFNTSNAPGQTSLILGVNLGNGSNYDYPTTSLFYQKTNDFAYYTLRGTIQSGGIGPALNIVGTCLDTFDIDVSALGGVAQTCSIKKIS